MVTYIAHDDKHGNLWLLNLASGENRKIKDGAAGHFGLSSFSLVSRYASYLAFAVTTKFAPRTPSLGLLVSR